MGDGPAEGLSKKGKELIDRDNTVVLERRGKVGEGIRDMNDVLTTNEQTNITELEHKKVNKFHLHMKWVATLSAF